MTDGPLLEVSGLKKHFDQSDGFVDKLLGDAGAVRAVDGVDLSVASGETLAVVGESGCGKSTLGRTLLNLDQPTAGTIRFGGDDITGLSDHKMRPYRRRMQMVFQDPLASLNPRQTVGQIVKAPLEVHGIGADDAERTERVKSLLERVGLDAAHVDRHPGQFSGGQQQRIALARALSLEPDLLVADEPVSALDVSVQAQILSLLDDLQDEFGLALLFVTHDLSVVKQIADRVAVMYLGQLVEVGPVDGIFAEPRHPYTRSLLSAVPRIDPDARTDRVILEGTVPSPSDPPSGCRFHTRCPEIVPHDGWEGSQQAFRRAFTYRTRVTNDEIDPDAIEDRLNAEGNSTDVEGIASGIVDSSLPGDIADLPADAQSAVELAAVQLARGDDSEAAATVREAFPSPCATEEPTTVDAGGVRVGCHRVDPERSYESRATAEPSADDD